MLKISVIIPLYNKEKYIERAIRSVLSQTIQCDEIIVVDDGSTDKGPNIVNNINNPLINIITQKNKGVSSARNKGIKEAKGDLIAFLDADDTWEPGFIEVIKGLVNKYPNAGAYGTAYKYNIGRLPLQKKAFDIFPNKQKDGLVDYIIASNKCGYSILTSSSTVVPKKVLEEIGLFPGGEIINEDLDTWLRISFKYLIAWSKEYLINISLHNDNIIRKRLHKEEPKLFITARMAIINGLINQERVIHLSEFLVGRKLLAAGDFLLQGKTFKINLLLEETKNAKRFNDNVKWHLLYLLNKLPNNIARILWKILSCLHLLIYLIKLRYFK